jgi:DNA-binding transcriptional LysR family regulator
LREYRRRFPEVDIHTVDGGQEHLMCALASNTIDVAIMTSDSPNGDGRCLPLWSERVIAAIPDSHPLSGLSAVDWANFAGERLLVPSHRPGPELERLLATKLRQLGPNCLLRQDVCIERLMGIERLMALVGLGFGLLLVLEGATGAHYDGAVYREVRDHVGLTRVDFMACWRDENGNPTLGPFIEMLRERYPDLSVATEVV